MLDLSTVLKHYKRPDVQKAIVASALGREVGVKFGKIGAIKKDHEKVDYFGKRPDVIMNPSDIIELAKQGATSFHVSEERWTNPLQLSTELRKQELDNLRSGWDFVLDIDCPVWEYSKLITHLLIKALKAHGVSSISCKFSGNKGFHIGVPFEVFPKIMNEQERVVPITHWFPDGPKKVALYLIHYIDSKQTNFELSGKVLAMDSLQEVARKLEKMTVAVNVCLECDTIMKTRKHTVQSEFSCPSCQHKLKIEEAPHQQCPKCKTIFSQSEIQVVLGRIIEKTDQCTKCGSRNIAQRLNPEVLINVDTVLIASRHLFRSVYSLHEKSGLVSVPIPENKVLSFQKNDAHPSKITHTFDFLQPRTQHAEALNLFTKANEWFMEKEIAELEEKRVKASIYTYSSDQNEFIEFEEKVPIEMFPPCMLNILRGVEDGKKRSMFILLNFLRNVGWDYESIEELLVKWNKKNKEQLRESVLRGHIRYHRQNKKKVLPPNCDNKAYYQDFHVCTPDNLCSKIKNPVNYTRRKAFTLLRKPQTKREENA